MTNSNILTSRWREFQTTSHKRDLSWLVTKLTGHGEFQCWLETCSLVWKPHLSHYIQYPPCWYSSISLGSFLLGNGKKNDCKWNRISFFTLLSTLLIHIIIHPAVFCQFYSEGLLAYIHILFIIIIVINRQVLVRRLVVLAINIIISSVVYNI